MFGNEHRAFIFATASTLSNQQLSTLKTLFENKTGAAQAFFALMKTKHLLWTLLLAPLTWSVACTGLLMPKGRNTCSDTVLLTTHWKQMGGFEKYTPDSLRTGCWSTALAQIMFFHKLKPFGNVAYTSRNGYRINETPDSAGLDLGSFTAVLDSTTPAATADQMAKYNYYAALAVRKDFGTDRYMNKLAPASLFENHYHVKAHRYISWRKIAPYTNGRLEKIIALEIDERRPVFLHFANLKGFGHSVVIDGYCYRDGKLQIHINQGQGGPQDGWYEFGKGILRPDDGALRVIYTFRPAG